MNIAYDLDGVARESRLGALNLMTQLEKSNVQPPIDIAQWWAVELGTIAPLLNPWLFAQKEDRVYVLTALIKSEDGPAKKAWVHHFYGPRVRVRTVRAPRSFGRDYVVRVADAKLALMAKYRIDVYFDDNPSIVRYMRKKAAQMGIGVKILRYGPWIDDGTAAGNSVPFRLRKSVRGKNHRLASKRGGEQT